MMFGIVAKLLIGPILRVVVRTLGVKLTLALITTLVGVRAWTSRYWNEFSPPARPRRSRSKSRARKT
jgi:hypothetical protein